MVTEQPRLTALTPYGPRVPSTRVRVRHWLDRTGIPATLIDYAGLPNHSPKTLAGHPGAWARAEWQQRTLARQSFDRLLIHKEVTPLSSGGLAEKLAARSQLSVYDFDDAVMWTEELGGGSALARAARSVFSKADACRRTVSAVDRVIAGNEVLAEWAGAFNPDVRLIPSCVEPGEYTVKADFDISGPPRMVWLGSPATEPQLALVADALLAVHRDTGARLTVISGGDGPDLGAAAQMVDRVQWYPGVEATLAGYDMAIAPLQNLPYERGKCAYKILQYGASALPTIGSPVAANATVLHALGQITAASTQQWVDAMRDLLAAAPAERAAMGQRARTAVQAGYSFEVWQQQWLDAVGFANWRPTA